jgi:hypothetical protein
MPKKKVDKLTAEQAAEKARPNWKAVAPIVTDAARRVEADETAPELGRLKSKYLGETAVAGPKAVEASKAVTGLKAVRPKKAKPDELKIVVMEPRTPSDTHVERKAVLVNKKGNIVGEQG